MAKKAQLPTRKRVVETVACDTNRLYGPIRNAIKYLQEVATAHPELDLCLHEEWTGYEDMHLEFIYSRDETDEEMAARVSRERREAEQDAARANREAERREKERQFEKLRQELGR